MVKNKDRFCEACDYSGTIVKDGVTEICMCRILADQKDRINRGLEASRIPAKYHHFTFDSWNNPGADIQQRVANDDAFDVVEKYASRLTWCRDEGVGLFICGPNGVGKTMLACVVGIHAISQNFVVRFYTLANIISLTVDGWFDKEQVASAADDIASCDFLIVDDLDKVYATKTGIEVALFDNMFRERLQNGRPIIFTTNKTLEDTKDSFNNSVYSMFKEQSIEVVIVGNDYRDKISDELHDKLFDE